MIGTAYVQMMARYNAWQNAWLIDAVGSLSAHDLRADRGAFFGSVFGTLNHLLWGDQLWMSRFDGGPGPTTGIPHSGQTEKTLPTWKAARIRTDGRITNWANTVRPAALRGDLKWYSGSMGRDVTQPTAMCITHFFNHQTHHRGQIHAMLTAAGVKTSDTDLVFMSVEGA